MFAERKMLSFGKRWTFQRKQSGSKARETKGEIKI